MRPKIEHKKEHSIRTLGKRTQVIRNFCGAYDMAEGYIELGCDEEHCPTIIWHETIHKLLFEGVSLESTFMWDNIANEIQYYLFNVRIQDEPYIYSQPQQGAKEEDGGAWRNGRKQKEKSERTGWKPSIKKRIPVRSHKDILEKMGYININL